jgi:hypothetical protein
MFHGDVREIDDPSHELKLLASNGLMTNERNPYRAFAEEWGEQPRRVEFLSNHWKKQHDVQIDTIEMYFKTGMWEDLSEKQEF